MSSLAMGSGFGLAMYVLWFIVWMYETKMDKTKWSFRFTFAPFAVNYFDSKTNGGYVALLFCELSARK